MPDIYDDPAWLRAEVDRLRRDNVRLVAATAADPSPASEVTPTGLDRESWLRARLSGGVGAKTKDAALAILASRTIDDPYRAVLVEALHDVVDETERWKTAWSCSQVNADRQYREAIARSKSCEDHGRQIVELKGQLTHAERSEQRVEKARLVLVDGLHQIRRAVDSWKIRQQVGVETADTMAALLDALSKALDTIHNRHQRAFTKEVESRD